MAKDRASMIAAWTAVIVAVGNLGSLVWTQKPWWIAGEEDKKEIEEGRKAIRELEMIRIREQLMLEARHATTTASGHGRPLMLPPPPAPSPIPVSMSPMASSSPVMGAEPTSSIWSWIRIGISAALFLGSAGFFTYRAFKKKD